jgi:hypothetical protein
LTAHNEVGHLPGSVSRHAERLRKIIAGSGWNDGESARFPGAENRVRNLSAGSVTSDCDDRAIAGANGARRKLFLFSRRRCFERRVNAAGAERGAQGGESSVNPAAAGGRIHDQTRRLEQCLIRYARALFAAPRIALDPTAL